jgi:predicted membrane channel-forming protein YqfA (hemolysin III family)
MKKNKHIKMNSSLIRRTKGDEILNSISHGVGIGISVAATVLLVVKAAMYGTVFTGRLYCLFNFTIFLLMAVKTIHARCFSYINTSRHHLPFFWLLVFDIRKGQPLGCPFALSYK